MWSNHDVKLISYRQVFRRYCSKYSFGVHVIYPLECPSFHADNGCFFFPILL
jgi:hypothetical protein